MNISTITPCSLTGVLITMKCTAVSKAFKSHFLSCSPFMMLFICVNVTLFKAAVINIFYFNNITFVIWSEFSPASAAHTALLKIPNSESILGSHCLVNILAKQLSSASLPMFTWDQKNCSIRHMIYKTQTHVCHANHLGKSRFLLSLKITKQVRAEKNGHSRKMVMQLHWHNH